MKIETIAMNDLITDPNNARVHGRRNLATLEDSLKKFGQYKPLVVHKDTMVILAGNGLFWAMRERGIKTAECHFVDLDEASAKALSIMDNRSGDLSSWDMPQLAENLDSLPDDLLEATGYDQDELDGLIERYINLPDPGAGPPISDFKNHCPKCDYRW